MEAKSSRDSSWYDVGSFLNHRVTANGEFEARVRFTGFDRSHDEWINVKSSIRERSIPLVESECHLIEVGDLVLCYRKIGDSELYYDAHIVQIERKLHDIQGCKCSFQVLYDHDNDEETVVLSKLCRRSQ
ncbi:hypothetical protein LIER_17650 [Lithospermum erythrorhizon]|uniref:SAWADEE domain-containing protein n=1 Tax=Lithospermum erythrorhizon TaxID=34254 RepID=A0AAV3QB31_LITER